MIAHQRLLNWQQMLLIAAFLGLGVMAALAIVDLGSMGAVAVIGMVILAGELFFPLPWVFTALVAATFVLIGPAQYFLGGGRIFWLPYLAGLVLYIRLLMEASATQRHESEHARGIPGFVHLLILFLAIVIIGAVANRLELLQLFVAGKEPLFLWSLLFLIAFRHIDPSLVHHILGLAPWYLLLQLPVLLIQRFLVMPSRSDAAPWDAMTGLLPGAIEGGGQSGAMGLLTIACMVIVYARWRAGVASGRQSLAAIVLGLVSIALAEVKFALLLLPIAALLLQGSSLVRRPLTSIPFMLAVIAICAGIALLYGRYDDRHLTAQQQIEQWFEVNTDPDQFERRTNEIGRIAAIEQWFADVKHASALSILLGHGVGESRLGTVVSGDLAQKMGFALDRNSLSLLLWETGILGAAAFVLTIIFGLISAAQLSRRCRIPMIRADMKAATVILLLLLLTLAYTSDVVTTSQIQLLFIMFLGVAAAHARAPADRTVR